MLLQLTRTAKNGRRRESPRSASVSCQKAQPRSRKARSPGRTSVALADRPMTRCGSREIAPNPSSPLSASHEAGWTDRHLASLPRGKAWAYLSINLRRASDIPEHNFNEGAMESNQEQLLVDGNVSHGVWRACCGRDWR
jgi:hypothetical protein